ncbi:phosphonate C-P lyase system protein PhnG [Denitrobaculum tricleocarpae]|nr:phosphonate C-P lyase system protein PhnG [Denitrobaculum tricleocarpae]
MNMSNHIASSSEDQREPGNANAQNSDRGAWMSILAKADPGELSRAWDSLDDKPTWRWLRKPETGLVMVRGRAGGTGAAFNLGEMTVTRCAVVTESGDGNQGFTGQGYLAGRDRRHAELAALFDALLQDSSRRSALEDTLLKPLADGLAARRRAASAKSAATKVDFFTLVRGED